MKKISWFRRLFMSWNALENYFKVNSSDISDFLPNQQLIEFQTANKLYISQLEELKIDTKLWQEQLNKAQKELETIKLQNQNLENDNTSKKINIEKKDNEIQELHKKILSYENEIETWRKDLLAKMAPLETIQKTFFGSWNKGKGELGELQLEQILIESGLNENNWMINLNVSKTKENSEKNDKSVVEFALRSSNSNKWIPVDSKVLEPLIIDDEIYLDDTWINSLKTQVKKIASLYLNKTYTESYGMLVLHNDLIYLKLYKEFPNIIKSAIENHKIHILSPSMFIQFAWNLDNLLEFSSKLEKGAKLYNHVISIFETLNKFSNKLKIVQKDLNIAMDTHFPNLERKKDTFDKLIKKDPLLLEEKD